MELGLLGANVDKLAHGKVWCVRPHGVISARLEM